MIDLRLVHPAVRAEVPEALERARGAGASGDVEYVGAGMTAIVFCSGRLAYKVYRGRGECSIFRAAEAEAEFLFDATHSPARADVAAFVDWHPESLVLERACVRGHPAGWGTRGVRDTFDRIQGAMRPLGWSGPEFKEDSFIVRESDGRLVLVDAGFVHRLGERLLTYVDKVLNGDARCAERVEDLHWQLRMDVQDGRLAPAAGALYMLALEERSADRERLVEDREYTLKWLGERGA